MSHSAKLALGILCVVALAGFLIFLTQFDPTPAEKEADLGRKESSQPSLGFSEPRFEEGEEFDSPESTHRRSAAEAASLASRGTAAEEGSSSADPGWSTGWVTLTGRFVDAEKQPVRNLPMYLRGRFLTGDARDKYDPLLNWSSKRLRSNGKGEFELRVRISPQFHLTLETKSKEHVNLSWDWKNLQPGEARELGDIRISKGGTIVGEVLRADGGPMVEGWRLRARHADRSVAKEINKRPSRKEPGTFRIENIQEGEWDLDLRMEGGMPDGGRFVAAPEGNVTVKEGKVAKITYRYEGPPMRTRLRIDLDVGRIKHVFPLARHVRVSGPAGVLTVGEGDDIVRSHTFEDIAPGEYTLVVDDPRFRPVQVGGLDTGAEQHTVEVRGNATITLLVRDSRTRKPVERYNVKMREWEEPVPEIANPEDPRSRMRRSFGSSWVQNVKRTADFPGGKLVLDDITAGSYVVMIDADGHSRTEVEVLGLSPNEERKVEIDLRPGGVIRGVVLDADAKTAREGVKVAIQPADEASGDEPWSRMGGFVRTMRGDTGFQQVETDARGRFAFEGLTPGAYAIRAQYDPPQEGFLSLMTSFTSGGSGLSVEGETLTVNHGQVLDDVKLVLPPSATIKGRVLGPPNANFADLQLSFQSLEDAERNIRVVTKLDDEGRFVVGPVFPTVLNTTLLFFDEESPFETFREGLASKDLGQITVRTDPTEEFVLDARPHWPGKLTLLIESSDGPLGDARVSLEDVLEPTGSGGGPGRFFRTQRGETNAEGRIVFSAVMAGAKEITVTGPDGRWTYRLPAPLQVSPGDEIERTIRIDLFRGRVRFRDVETGEILAGRSVYIRRVEGEELVSPVEIPRGGPGRRRRASEFFFAGGDNYRTDDQGYVELELPAGNYSSRLIRDVRRDGPPSVAAADGSQETREEVDGKFSWGAGGAAPADLQIGTRVVHEDR